MRDIRINVEDLQRILAAMFELDVEARQHRAVINHAMIENQPLRARYAELLRLEKEKAEEETLPRYQLLNDALASTDDAAIREKLEKFAHRALT